MKELGENPDYRTNGKFKKQFFIFGEEIASEQESAEAPEHCGEQVGKKEPVIFFPRFIGK